MVSGLILWNPMFYCHNRIRLIGLCGHGAHEHGMKILITNRAGLPLHWRLSSFFSLC
jgi:hypothetical protein